MNMHQLNNENSGERGNGPARPGFDLAAQDPELEAVLKDFRASVHAWSDTVYRGRALVLAPTPRRTLWNRALVWALSLVLTAGIGTEAAYLYHQKQLARQMAIQREIDHQRLVAQQHAREADELLARVDSDVSREVPSAMEPLASLMVDDGTQ